MPLADDPLPYVCDRCQTIRWVTPDGYFSSYPMCLAGHGGMRRTTASMAESIEEGEEIDLSIDEEVEG